MEILKLFFPCLMEHPIMFIMTLSFIWVMLFGTYIIISSLETFIVVPLKERKTKKSNSCNW